MPLQKGSSEYAEVHGLLTNFLEREVTYPKFFESGMVCAVHVFIDSDELLIMQERDVTR
jgi:hypothetical protein